MWKASRAGSYQNLIDFVPQKVDSQETKPRTRKFAIAYLEGNSVKTFYETVIKDKDSKFSQFAKRKSVGKNKSRSSLIKKQSHFSTSFERAKSGDDSFQCSTETTHVNQSATNSSKCNEVSNTDHSSINTSNFKGTTTSNSSRDTSKLLHSAQIGDCIELQRLVETSGVNIDSSDMFGWTALMCAAHAGQFKAVQSCLKLGADAKLTNNSGGTAEDLARSAGHLDISVFIPTFVKETNCGRKEDNIEKSEVPEASWCDLCQVSFTDTSTTTRHANSTVHLFNVGHKPAPPSFSIPQSNKGYQMLLRTGWGADCGLGPTGAGKKYPVKTIFKQDRKGLGTSSTKRAARVTHFEPHDRSAVSSKSEPLRVKTAKTAARDAQRSKIRKDRRWEQNIRRQLNDDFCF